MATFVLIEPDAFNRTTAAVAAVQKQRDTHDGGVDEIRIGLYHHVRRPVRGIQIKEDTYATIQVRQSNGIAIPLFDAASRTDTGRGVRNSNFIIQSIQEQRAEKQQIVLTFGSPYLFLFGEQPRMISVSGILLNTEDFNWRSEWWANYDQYLRGSQCVRNKSRVYLSWDDIVVEGYIIAANAAEDANNQNVVQFQFQMFLTNYQSIANIGDPNAHWQGKEIDLNPADLDLPGQGNGNSNTLLVRNANVTEAQLAAGKGSGSLFEFLRQGNITAAADRFSELRGQVVDLLELAGQFVSGRNIRVPRGFEGAAAFDQDVQIALASVPGASAIINGTGDRTVTLQSVGGTGLVTQFRANLEARFGPARTGLPLSANEDEFIARTQQDDTGAEKFNNLFIGQLAKDIDAGDKVREVFEAYGIDVDPPDELTRLFRNTMFGIVSIAAGMNLANSPTLRTGINALGTVL